MRVPLLLAAALAVPGCGQAPAANVLQLEDVNPRQLEAGDRVEVLGHNFPAAADIRRISVTFRGTLARPGLPPCDAPIEFTLTDPPADATAVDLATGATRELTYAESTHRTIHLDGATRLEFLATEDVLRQLSHCPGSRDARREVPHATIALGGVGARSSPHGVTVRIEGLTGGQAIAGTLRGPTLDLHAPSARRLALDTEALHTAERVLDFTGITLAQSHPTEGGLRVLAVRAGSPADTAGIAANDVLLRMDGVTLLAVTDFRPSPTARTTTVTALRGDVQDDRVVSLEGLVPTAPRDLIAAAMLLAVLAGLFALAMLPHPGVIAWLDRRAGPLSRARGDDPSGVARVVRFVRWVAAAALHPLRRRAMPGANAELAREVPALLVTAVASSVLLTPLGPYFLGSGLDVAMLYFTAVCLGLAVAAVGARRTATRSALRASLGAAARIALTDLPAALALVAAVALGGSLRLRGVVEVQGGWPWEWLLFRTPVAPLLFALYLSAALLGSAGVLARMGSTQRAPDAAASAKTVRVARAIGASLAAGVWLRAFVLCAVGTAVFCGGWQLPGTSAAELETRPLLVLVGAAVFLAKTWAAMGAVLFARWALPRLRPEDVTSLARRSLVPLALLGVALAVAWVALTPRVPRAAQTALAGGTFVLFVVLAVARLLRGAVIRARGTGAIVPDPFA